jgi:prepilin-type N-terminal cleavage/methylation domain-containing protein
MLRQGRGFTLIELLVVVGIFIILLSIFIPYAMSRRETARIVACADHLRQIRDALDQYARVNHNHFPRVRADVVARDYAFQAFTGPESPDPFADDSQVQENDATAALWLLVRQEYLADPGVFVCPSTSDTPDEAGAPRGSRSNFRQEYNLSYSIANPYGAAPRYGLHRDLPAKFVVLADMNPGVRSEEDNVLGARHDSPPLELSRANSRNHRKVGQNVLYAYGNVEFSRTPFCGVNGDNIYSAIASAPLGPDEVPDFTATGFFGQTISPAHAADSYLVPAR